ncbi:unnamed protein product [Zymoseptoria tritici ST99CH_1A5]|uniref:Uncharacterized protein n=1 Tax=Zymoseptoria tritici ST99CH_1A5 TaxID=1276529 RepID=A0A1Y6M1T7_ZYMTR|nr:unnamed protein product [Zymoseptoria tritici ST99CH_1A5]
MNCHRLSIAAVDLRQRPADQIFAGSRNKDQACINFPVKLLRVQIRWRTWLFSSIFLGEVSIGGRGYGMVIV